MYYTKRESYCSGSPSILLTPPSPPQVGTVQGSRCSSRPRPWESWRCSRGAVCPRLERTSVLSTEPSTLVGEGSSEVVLYNFPSPVVHLHMHPTHPHTPSHILTPSQTGFALAALLHSDGTGDATMTICHEHTPPDQLPVMTRTADILIVGKVCVCSLVSRAGVCVCVCQLSMTVEAVV